MICSLFYNFWGNVNLNDFLLFAPEYRNKPRITGKNKQDKVSFTSKLGSSLHFEISLQGLRLCAYCTSEDKAPTRAQVVQIVLYFQRTFQLKLLWSIQHQSEKCCNESQGRIYRDRRKSRKFQRSHRQKINKYQSQRKTMASFIFSCSSRDDAQKCSNKCILVGTNIFISWSNIRTVPLFAQITRYAVSGDISLT